VHALIFEQGYERAGKHHEICLGDPRRTAPEKLKTAGLSSLARQYHDLDISRRLARWWLTASVRRRAIVISTGAAINTNHVTKIARTSKR
jgi:hypothetical protein